MKRFPFILRLATLSAYFFPFAFYLSTCVGSQSRIAYNKKDAYKNEADANAEKLKSIGFHSDNLKTILTEKNKKAKLDSFKNKIIEELTPFSINPVALSDSLNENKLQNAFLKVFFPNYYSVSGIGVLVAYKNIYERIVTGISLLLSFLTLILWKLLKRKKAGLYLIGINFSCTIIILVNSFIFNIDLLWGFWLIFILLFLQLLLEINRKRKLTES